MPRIPLLAGSRMLSASVSDDVALLVPPPPLDPIADVGEAVRGAFRYPLSRPALADVVRPGSRATIVVEPPALPLPGVGTGVDPRQLALEAAITELERLGVSSARQTILVAGGLQRRAGQRELSRLVRPSAARAFRGAVRVHDCESPDLVPLAPADAPRVDPSLVETDLVLCVSAAETVIHGGPATLLAASSAETARATTADSLLEPRTSGGWSAALALERAVEEHAPTIGLSLVLDHPRLSGMLDRYPHDPASWDRVARHPARPLLNAAPAALRRRSVERIPRTIRAVAALAGKPSVAHAEALLRGVSMRGVRLDRPLDAIVVPIPWKWQHHPREPLNPVSAAVVGLAVALRLWRDSFPVTPGGTAVLLHGFAGAFSPGTGSGYRDVLLQLREGDDDAALRETEETAARDGRALDGYRAGRAPHPRQAYADWDACRPALRRLGRVIAGACRDGSAARALGFVPSHSVGAALEMASGTAGEDARVGVLLAPPYTPLLVG